MEFEEMKKIWDSQNNEPLYVLNEEALHNRIRSQKRRAGRVAGVSEFLLIGVNLVSGIFVAGLSFFQESRNVFMYLMALWMMSTGLFIWFMRVRRVRGESVFGQSLSDDLAHALSNATYQVRISMLMRWNIVPIAVLSVLGFWHNGKPVWMMVLLLFFFALAHFAGGWEHNVYKSRKRSLEILKRKLTEEG